MHTIVTLAVLLDRVALSMFSVALAATLILLATPEALVSPGFQMSFAAVIALIAAYERGELCFFLRNRWLTYVVGLSITSFIASIATTPFSIYTFQQCSLMSIPANMLAVPLTGTWIMPCAVAALLLMPFGREMFFLKAMGLGIQLLMNIAETVAGWYGAHLIVAPPSAGVLGLGVLGTLWVVLWHKRWRFLGLIPVGTSLLLCISTPPPDFMIDAAATCVGVRTDQQLLITSRNHARSAQKTWSQRLGSPSPFKKRECVDKGLWRFPVENKPTVLVTDGLYEGNLPCGGYLHIDLSDRFSKADLRRKEILDGLGGYVSVQPDRRLLFQSVRQAVGNRPWSFKGTVVPPIFFPRKNVSKGRDKLAPPLHQELLDDDGKKTARKCADHVQLPRF
jgi:hypothetical protein